MRADFLGILMLETRFPRPPGDIGNAATFAFPVRYEIVRGASPQRVVRGGAAELLAPFVEAGQRLAAAGARGIATSCGFLARFQRPLTASLPVPVATSSLLQIAWLRPLLAPDRSVGVVTIDAAALGVDHLSAVGVDREVPIEGVAPQSEFARRLLGDEPMLDTRQAERDVVDAARRLVRRRPDVAAIVLECTNMPPYAPAVAAATARPVFDAVTMLNWFWSGLMRGRR